MSKKFEVDITPSWGFVAESILALLDCNEDISGYSRTYIKSQLSDMSRVADLYVKLAKENK